MSRSLKTGSDNPGSEKAGARTPPAVKARSKRQGWTLVLRHTFGGCEKILRRSRKIWTRLHAKEGRRLDKAAVHEGLDDATLAQTTPPR